MKKIDVFQIQPLCIPLQYLLKGMPSQSQPALGKEQVEYDSSSPWMNRATGGHRFPKPSRAIRLRDESAMSSFLDAQEGIDLAVAGHSEAVYVEWEATSPQIVQKWQFILTDEVLSLLEKDETFLYDVFLSKWLFPLMQQSELARELKREALSLCPFYDDSEVSDELMDVIFPFASDHFLLHADDVGALFSHSHLQYESREQMKHAPSFVHDLEKGHLHFGWGYSTASGLMEEQIYGLVRLVASSQARWYVLRELTDKVRSLVVNDGYQERSDLVRAEELSRSVIIHFERLRFDYAADRMAMAPKYREVEVMLSQNWGMAEDFDKFERLVLQAHRIVERELLHLNELGSRRQTRALLVIALIEVFAIISIAIDYISLRTATLGTELGGVMVVLLPLVLSAVAIFVAIYTIRLPRKIRR